VPFFNVQADQIMRRGSRLCGKRTHGKRTAVPPSFATYACVEFANGSSESILLLEQVGSFSRVSASQRAGPCILRANVAMHEEARRFHVQLVPR
jgi:hypothetical protein